MPAILEPISGQLTAMAELAAEVRAQNRGLLRDLRIETVDRGIVLHGFAYSFYGKQIALREVRKRCERAVMGNCITVQKR